MWNRAPKTTVKTSFNITRINQPYLSCIFFMVSNFHFAYNLISLGFHFFGW